MHFVNDSFSGHFQSLDIIIKYTPLNKYVLRVYLFDDRGLGTFVAMPVEGVPVIKP